MRDNAERRGVAEGDCNNNYTKKEMGEEARGEKPTKGWESLDVIATMAACLLKLRSQLLDQKQTHHVPHLLAGWSRRRVSPDGYRADVLREHVDDVLRIAQHRVQL